MLSSPSPPSSSPNVSRRRAATAPTTHRRLTWRRALLERRTHARALDPHAPPSPSILAARRRLHPPRPRRRRTVPPRSVLARWTYWYPFLLSDNAAISVLRVAARPRPPLGKSGRWPRECAFLGKFSVNRPSLERRARTRASRLRSRSRTRARRLLRVAYRVLMNRGPSPPSLNAPGGVGAVATTRHATLSPILLTRTVGASRVSIHFTSVHAPSKRMAINF